MTDRAYQNRPLSLNRVREIQHRQIQTVEQFNKKRLSDDQRSALNERVVKEAKRLDKERK